LLSQLREHGLAQRLQGLRILVLDEADRMLDMGFQKDMMAIAEFLPAKRQTCMFSATIPPGFPAVAKAFFAPDYTTIDVVGAETSDLHDHIPQHVATVPVVDLLPTAFQIILDHAARKKEYKIVVFFPTAQHTKQLQAVFAAAFPQINSLPIHSRMSQTQRERISASFRTPSPAVLFSSDVSARGMDYPDVTLVLQVGIPSDCETYVHRIGRTGRGQKDGEGFLLLADFEKRFTDELHKANLSVMPASAPAPTADTQKAIQAACTRMQSNDLERIYVGFLGFYKAHMKRLGLSPASLVRIANTLVTKCLFAPGVPAIKAMILGKMGLRGTPGLIEASRSLR